MKYWDIIGKHHVFVPNQTIAHLTLPSSSSFPTKSTTVASYKAKTQIPKTYRNLETPSNSESQYVHVS